MPYHQWQAPPQEAAVGGPGQPALQLPTPRPENHWGLGRPEELLPQPTELESATGGEERGHAEHLP